MFLPADTEMCRKLPHPASLLTRLLLVMFTLLVALPFAHARETVPSPKHLLIVTVTKGFRHKDSIPVAEQALKELGETNQTWTVDYVRTDEEMAQKMSATGLKAYDGIVFASTTGELPLPDRGAFLQWIRDGHAFIGIHAATDTFHQWPDYIEMIGAHFKTHGPQVFVECLSQDRTHPAMRFWGGDRLIFDEIYQFDKYDPATFHHLIDMDRHPNTKVPGDYPVAWCKEYGKGRVFYTALGHRPDVWKSLVYQQHLLGGIRWALGLDPGNATPQRQATSLPSASAARVMESNPPMPEQNSQNSQNTPDSWNRRDLLGRGSLLALGLLVGGATGLRAEELIPSPATLFAVEEDATPPVPVTVAVIGLGEQGRALLTSLIHVPGAQIAYVCDDYEAAHPKALEIVPKAQAVKDYHQVLNDKAVQAVFVATPTHLHKQIVLEAIQAGKHVYCEAPLAGSIDDARAIAKAALATAPRQTFHTGLQQRTNPQHKHVLGFVRTGALATIAQAKSTWHKKDSWRRQAPNDTRQAALNWRLKQATSTGLMGEIGIHQVDVTSWFLKKLPTAVTGFGGIMAWNDGRDVPDTVQCIVEYPGSVRLAYDATLANSFDGAYELFQGTDSAVLIRDGRAWMFKESDSTELGWEVYAYKEKVGEDTVLPLLPMPPNCWRRA